MNQPRFVAIVTPHEKKLFAVFDRVTKRKSAATDDRVLAHRLAAEFSVTYRAPWYVRAWARIRRRELPAPPPDPVEIPEWQQRLDRINAICNERKRRRQLANGGRIVRIYDADGNDSIN